jgi:ubiquinone/menaquinone biosynthesis C-methylase UbiE
MTHNVCLAAPEYHRVRFTFDPSRGAVWGAVGAYLQRYIPEGEAVLDLGAGYGEFVQSVQAREKWALDCNPDLRQYWGREVRPLIQSALEPLPLAGGALGAVLASNFFEHFTVEECRAVLSEVWRVLKPGGRLLAVQPNYRLEPGRYFDDYTHKTAFSDVSFTGFLRSLGWRIARCEPRFLPFSMKSRLPKWGWLVRSYLALPYRPLAGQFLVIAERE